MKNFTLLHETPEHFVLHNGVAHFHVSKRGIDEPTADRIRSLAKGGEVTPDNALNQMVDSKGIIGGTIKDGSDEERFHFHNFTFDIDKARDISKKKPNGEVEVSSKWLDKIRLDKEAAMNSKSENPVFIAQIHTAQGLKPLLIDGNHRMYKAAQEGKKTIPAYIFSPEQTVSLMTDKYPKSELHKAVRKDVAEGKGPQMVNGSEYTPKKNGMAEGGEVPHDKKNLKQLDSSMHQFLKEEGEQKISGGGQMTRNMTHSYYANGGSTEQKESFHLENPPPANLDDLYKPTPLPTPDSETPRKLEVPETKEKAMAKGGYMPGTGAAGSAMAAFRKPEKYNEGDEVQSSTKDLGPMEEMSMLKHGMDVTNENDRAKYKAMKKLKEESGLPMFNDGGDTSGAQDFQDAFRKATHYADGGTTDNPEQEGFFESVKKAFKSPEPTPQPTPQETKDEEIRRKSRLSITDPSNPEAYAKGGTTKLPHYPGMGGNLTNSAKIHDISKENQTEAIKRYADDNPVTLATGGVAAADPKMAQPYAKGGHVHTQMNQGKNTLHFHFYDGAVVPTALDKEEGAGPQQPTPLDKYVGGEPATGTPLDKYVNLADPEGDVGDEAENQSITEETPSVNLSATDVNPGATINQPGPTPLQQQMAQAQAEQNPTPEQTANNLASAMGQQAPFSAPNSNATPTTVAPNQQVRVAQVPPPAPGMNLMEQLNRATQLQQDALQKGADAQANYWDSQKDIITKQLSEQQQRYDTYNQVQKQDQDRLDTIFNAVATSKINPDRFWQDKTTGGKILGGIALLLGGVGAGAAGGPNQAMQIINNRVQQDIAAQKNDQTNTMNMYKLGLQKYHDDQAAYNFATLNANAMVAGQLQRAAAIAGSAQAKAAAQMGIAQLTQQSIPLQQSLAMHQVAMQMASGGAGTQGINPEMLPDEMRDRAVRLPNGNLGLSPTKEDAAIARKSFTSLSGMDQQLNQFLTTMKRIGPTVNPWGADAAASEAARNNIVLELNNLHGLNRLNDNEFKTYMSMVPTAGTWRPNRATAQIMALKQLVKNKQENEMGNNIEGYKAPKLTPLPPK